MKRIAALVIAVILSGCGEKVAEEAVRDAIGAGASARFQAVERHGRRVCGEVNSRSGNGAYLGYRRFVYDGDLDTAVIDPGPVGPVIAPAGAACSKPLSYQSVSERLACARGPELEAAASRREGFEEMWVRACG